MNFRVDDHHKRFVTKITDRGCSFHLKLYELLNCSNFGISPHLAEANIRNKLLH